MSLLKAWRHSQRLALSEMFLQHGVVLSDAVPDRCDPHVISPANPLDGFFRPRSP